MNAAESAGMRACVCGCGWVSVCEGALVGVCVGVRDVNACMCMFNGDLTFN